MKRNLWVSFSSLGLFLGLCLGLSAGFGCGGSGTKPIYHPPADLAMGTTQNPGDDMADNTQQPMDDMATDQTSQDDMAMMQQMNPADMAMKCSAPAKLYPPKQGVAKSLYCPFSGAMGMKAQYCQGGTEHCCEPKTGQADCQALATACPNGDTDWQCEDPVADCPKGQQCCASGTLVINPDQSCANYATGFHGTHCAANCAGNEIQICTSTGECSGKTCIPFKAKGNSVGGCH